MTYEYEAAITLGDGFGHVGASIARDAIEDCLRGCAEPGEEVFVAMDSETDLRLVIRTDREMGDNEAAMLREAMEDVLPAISAGSTVTLGELALKDHGPTP